MKKWYICQYGQHHIQAPHECRPIGVALQKTAVDNKTDPGFVDMSAFSDWLSKKGLCAFGEGYANALGIRPQQSFPILYEGR